MRGTRPLPFGKEAIVALGARHGYIATGEAYEIMVFDLAGKRVGTIRDVVASWRRGVVASWRRDVVTS